MSVRARRWADDHPREFGWFVAKARSESIGCHASWAYVARSCNERFWVSISRELANELGELAIERDPRIRPLLGGD